jgi:hypothetical protein
MFFLIGYQPQIKKPVIVIPAQAGIHPSHTRESRLRGNDGVF